MAIVTLTSDFGTADGYVGAMKGVILSRAPQAVIVDIAHDVAPCQVAAGAYCLAQAAPYFPSGTIHVAVVDPGVGTERRAVIVDDGRCFYVAPDNGLVSLAVAKSYAAYSIESAAFMRAEVSFTFHGRDVFAAAAGYLAAGGRASDAGPQVALAALPGSDSNRAGRDRSGDTRPDNTPAQEVPSDGTQTTAIVHVDRFGNLITDCPGDRVPVNAQISAQGRTIVGISRTFGDVPVGALVAYVGSGGTLEVAIREGNAARTLGLGPGDRIELTLQSTNNV